MKKTMTISMAALFAAFISLSVHAAENPFGMSGLQKGSQTAMSSTPNGKCGDGKSSGDKKGKCGDGKSGEKSKCGDGKSGEKSKCGGN